MNVPGDGQCFYRKTKIVALIKFKLYMFFPLFNIFLGVVFLLIGFKIYRPFKKEKEEAMMKNFKVFYILGGFGLIGWGVIKFFQVI
jgi:hypothetical protein